MPLLESIKPSFHNPLFPTPLSCSSLLTKPHPHYPHARGSFQLQVLRGFQGLARFPYADTEDRRTMRPQLWLGVNVQPTKADQAWVAEFENSGNYGLFPSQAGQAPYIFSVVFGLERVLQGSFGRQLKLSSRSALCESDSVIHSQSLLCSFEADVSG